MKIVKLSVKSAIKAIKQGKVLVCPTDTVYGLICDAANKKAVARLYKIKKRPKSKAIPVFVSDIKMAKRFAKIDSRQGKFLREVWPGAVTVVLQKKRGNGTIGLRIPDHKWLLHLVEQLNRPVTETSANISGQPATTKIKEVLKQFKGRKYQPYLII